MDFNLDTINIALLFVTGINLLYGLTVFITNPKDKAVHLFSGVVLGVMLWTLSMLFLRGLSGVSTTILAARFLYFSAAIIPFVFLYFTFIFPDKNETDGWWKFYILPIPFLITSLISLTPDVLIKGVGVGSGQPIIFFDQKLHFFYGLYIIGFFSWAYINLFIKYFKLEGLQKTQIIYVIAGTLSATTVGVITNLILPFLGIFTYNWMGQIAVAVMVILISYAILKHHLFNVKTIATELLIFSLWIFILIRALIATNLAEKLLNGGLLLVTVVIGTLLIRSVYQEVRQREKIEKLAKDLEVANARLRELDQQKTEFLSFASHQLRAPLTAIKGYTSMLTEGSYGKISEKIKDPINKIFISSQHLLNTIEDFLNITRIELGKMEYKMTRVDLGTMTKDIIDALMPNAQAKKLKLTYGSDNNAPYNISVDYEKIRQVVLNLIDNAIKYTPAGFVKVSLSKNKMKGKILLAVSDSGLGITPELESRLFEKFSRGNEVSKVHVNGTGLGLFVAKEMVKAHGGGIWAESKGEGKGTTFYVEFLTDK